MIPRIARTVFANKGNIIAVVSGVGCTFPVSFAVSLSDETPILGKIGLMLAPVAGALITKVSLINSGSAWTTWQNFNEARRAFRTGTAAWPSSAQRSTVFEFAKLGARVGANAGLIVYVLGGVVLAFGCALSGDAKKAGPVMRDYAMLGVLICPLVGVAAGATVGAGAGAAITSRVLWG